MFREFACIFVNITDLMCNCYTCKYFRVVTYMYFVNMKYYSIATDKNYCAVIFNSREPPG